MNKMKFTDARWGVKDVFRYKNIKEEIHRTSQKFSLTKCAKHIILNLTLLMLQLKELINVVKEVRSSRKY
jgi:hypothetical protein